MKLLALFFLASLELTACIRSVHDSIPVSAQVSILLSDPSKYSIRIVNNTDSNIQVMETLSGFRSFDQVPYFVQIRAWDAKGNKINIRESITDTEWYTPRIMDSYFDQQPYITLPPKKALEGIFPIERLLIGSTEISLEKIASVQLRVVIHYKNQSSGMVENNELLSKVFDYRTKKNR